MKTHQDQENRAYSRILTSLFPEQTRTLPRILVWSLIFLADLCLVILGCYRLEILFLMFEHKLLTLLPFAAVFALFWLQGYVWRIFLKLKE